MAELGGARAAARCVPPVVVKEGTVILFNFIVIFKVFGVAARRVSLRVPWPGSLPRAQGCAALSTHPSAGVPRGAAGRPRAAEAPSGQPGCDRGDLVTESANGSGGPVAVGGRAGRAGVARAARGRRRLPRAPVLAQKSFPLCAKPPSANAEQLVSSEEVYSSRQRR